VPRGTYARYLPSPAEAQAQAQAQAQAEVEAEAAAAAAAARVAACAVQGDLPASRPPAPPRLGWPPRDLAGSDIGQGGVARTFRAFVVGDGAPEQNVACGLEPELCDTLARIRQLLSVGPGAVAAAHPTLRMQSQAQAAVQAHAARA